MKHKLPILIFLVLFFLGAQTTVKADGLVTVDSNGYIYWNVLAAESPSGLQVPKASDISIKQIAQVDSNLGASVALSKNGGQVNLVVSTGSAKKEINVSNWKQDLVEIEERPQVQKLNIGLENGKFSLRQGGVTALTDLPIQIDAKSAGLSVLTSTGNRFVSILPVQAVDTLLRAKYISRLTSTNSMELNEDASNNLVYQIKGEKIINILNVYNYKVDVEGSVSASTGEVLSVNEPTWLKLFGFMLS